MVQASPQLQAQLKDTTHDFSQCRGHLAPKSTNHFWPGLHPVPHSPRLMTLSQTS